MNSTSGSSRKKKKHSDPLFRRINNWLHLWLGLISGIIVFIVCITGCIWVFNEEITAFFEPETKVEQQDKPVLKPSELQAVVNRLYPAKQVAYAIYYQGRTVNVSVRDPERDIMLKMDPFTGEVIKKEVRKPGERDFFGFILNGHRFLWLPWEIGRPIVNYGTLIFVVLLITGLIWWYPKKWNKSTRQKSFTIKWGASYKRLNIDLHNVLGFYFMLFLLVIALTGMVWGLEWFSKGLYWTTSGGQPLPEYRQSESDSLQAGKFYAPEQAMDVIWATVISKHPASKGFYYSFPDTSSPKAAIYVAIYPSKGQFYDNVSYSFDQHTAKELKRDDVYAAQFAGAPFGVKLRKMNYDIHVGSILGFPGKVLAFLSSLVGASLPVTGFLIWWWRKKGGKKAKGRKKNGSEGKRQGVEKDLHINIESAGTPEALVVTEMIPEKQHHQKRAPTVKLRNTVKITGGDGS